jgi:hypothetical protein
MPGRFMAFDSAATNLVSGDTNGKRDIFVAPVCDLAGTPSTRKRPLRDTPPAAIHV